MTTLELLCRLMIEGEKRGLPRHGRITAVDVCPDGTVRYTGRHGHYRTVPSDTAASLVAEFPLALQALARELMRVPLVVRDRRPTRAQAACGYDREYDSVWLVWSAATGLRLVQIISVGTGRDGSVIALDDKGEEILLNVPAPGEVWRAVNPDGSPVMVEGEV